MGEHHVLVGRKVFKVMLPDAWSHRAFKVKVNEASAKVQFVEEIGSLKPFFMKVGGKLRQVELGQIEADGSLTVKVDGMCFRTRLENTGKRIVSAASGLALPLPSVANKSVKPQPGGKGVITASMPGKVAILRVKPGDQVHEGQILLVLESMKMENEIASPVNGIVKDVSVSEGMVVNVGETIIVVGEA